MKMESDKISIIIPIYNTDDKLLSLCVGSAINQTYRNLEVILVDDGSDNYKTIEKCQELVSKDSRIKLFIQENGGESAARKKGIDAATGTFMMFLDSDDCLYNDACEYLQSLISQGDYQFAEAEALEVQDIGGNERYDIHENYDIISLHGKHLLLENLIKDSTLPMSWSVWGKLYKADLIKKNYKVYQNIYRGVDVLTLARYLTQVESSIHSHKKIYCYNKGNINSITSQKRNLKNLSMCLFWKEMVDLYQIHAYKKTWSNVKAIYANCLVGCMLETMLYKYDGHQEIIKQFQGELKKYRTTIYFNRFMQNRIKNIIALVAPRTYRVIWRIRKIMSREKD